MPQRGKRGEREQTDVNPSSHLHSDRPPYTKVSRMVVLDFAVTYPHRSCHLSTDKGASDDRA